MQRTSEAFTYFSTGLARIPRRGHQVLDCRKEPGMRKGESCGAGQDAQDCRTGCRIRVGAPISWRYRKDSLSLASNGSGSTVLLLQISSVIHSRSRRAIALHAVHSYTQLP